MVAVVALVAWVAPSGCCRGDDADKYRIPDTLRVATLYSPTSFFMFREDTMGYDYSLILDFARDKNRHVEFTIAKSLEQAIGWLDSNKVDIIAYNVPVTSEYVERVYACGPEFFTSQVLIQPMERGDSLICDVTELVGKSVWVLPNSKYEHRLENLNHELGGGIDIRLIERDTISDDDIFEMVATGQLPLSVVSSDVAQLNQTYYKNVDASVQISFAQKSAWAVSQSRPWLGDSISAWFATDGAQQDNAQLLKRYFEMSKRGTEMNLSLMLKDGFVSPYDAIFKAEAQRIGWDWRLLAALGYIESQFNNDLVSWAGARGIMQIMPSTAVAYGIDPQELTDPARCIALAADIIQTSDKVMARYISDPEQRQIFTIATYNSGVAHIIDAIELAKKYGKDEQTWYGNVDGWLLNKSEPQYFNDDVVKHGYFRGRQTIEFVDNVSEVYKRICEKIKE